MSNVHLMLYQGGDGSAENLTLATQALDRATAIDPDNPSLAVSRGYFHYLGYLDYERALVEFKQAEKLTPNNPKVPEGMAYILRRMGKLDQALVQFDRALLLDPSNAHLHLHRANTLNALMQYSLAEKSYDRSIELFPAGTEAYRDQAKNTFEWRGSPERALDILERILSNDSIDVILDKARYMMYLRQYDAAAKQLSTIPPEVSENLIDQNRHLQVRLELALAQGDRSEALKIAAQGMTVGLKTIADHPQVAYIRTILAQFEAVLGERESALEHLQSGIEQGKEDNFYPAMPSAGLRGFTCCWARNGIPVGMPPDSRPCCSRAFLRAKKMIH